MERIQNMQIVRNPKGRTVALFDLHTVDLIIKDVRLMQGDGGRLLAQMPWKEYVSGSLRTVHDPVVIVKKLAYLEAVSQEAARVFEELTMGK